MRTDIINLLQYYKGYLVKMMYKSMNISTKLIMVISKCYMLTTDHF